jgi:hypothetical protein
MFSVAQDCTLCTHDPLVPCQISEMTDAATRDALLLVLEDGMTVPLRDDQKMQISYLATNSPLLDSAWLRILPTRVCFVSRQGTLMPIVRCTASPPEPNDPLPDEESMHLVIDRSSSMAHVDAAAYEGAKELLQQLPENTRVSVTLFSGVVHVGQRKTREEALQTLSLREANGSTSLNDAICMSIEAELQSPVARSTIVIVTDGQDTSSTRTKDETRRAVSRFQQRPNWRLLFLGSNQDAVLAAQHFGIPVGRAITYGTNSAHLQRAMRVASESADAFRRTRTDGFDSAQRTVVL